jgi:integrase/recombinase XerD
MLEKFKEYLLLNGYSLAYYKVIKRFLKKVKLENISKETIDKFLLDYKKTHSINGLSFYIRALKIFLKFMNKDILLPKTPKPYRKMPDSLDIEFFEKEIIPVVECIFDKRLKIKAFLYFLLYSGLRKGEMLLLKRENLDLENRIGKVVIPKTKEERLIIFSKKTADLLKDYFSIEPEDTNAFNLTEHKIKYIFDKLKLHFPNIQLRPHLFRHSIATHLIREGADITLVQKVLGHKDIKSTLHYLRTDDKTLKKMYDRYIK